MVRSISNLVNFSYTRQKEPLGLGHAVLTARELVGDEPFAVLLGDVIVPGPRPATRQLIEVYEETGVGAIAVEKIPKEKTHLYGIIDGIPAGPSRWGENLLRVRDMVEKPPTARSALEPRRNRKIRPAARNLRLPGTLPQPGARRRNPAHRRTSNAGCRSWAFRSDLRRAVLRCRGQVGLPYCHGGISAEES